MKSDLHQTVKTATTRSEWANVPHLLSTTWSQEYPYNLSCPSDDGGRCVTGCVATAMAQVIKYHNYPVCGNGTASYKWNGQTLSFDYSTANFDYDNMRKNYPASNDRSTKVQKEAVAKLMYACGVGVEMDYGSDESGAIDLYIASALKQYFNFDKSIQYLQRDFFTAEDWEEIVYEELQAGRPVIYGGSGEAGGHEFICDGYEDGYFHINWGWGGYGDGMFLLSALDPEELGTGGGSGGFNYEQSVICGIEPNAGKPEVSLPLYGLGRLKFLKIEKNTTAVLAVEGNLYNYSSEQIKTSFYLKAVSSTGEEYVSDKGREYIFDGMEGIYQFRTNLPKGPEGTYKAYVMYALPDGTLKPLMIPIDCLNYLTMNVDSEGKVTMSAGIPTDATGITLDVTEKTLKEGESFTLTATVTPANAKDKTVTWTSSNPEVAAVEGGLVTAIAVGSAVITATTVNGLTATCNVTVTEKPTEDPSEDKAKIEVTEFSPESKVYTGKSTKFNVTLQNTGTASYSGAVYFITFTSDTYEQIDGWGINCALDPGKIMSGYIDLTYDLPAGEYVVVCFDKDFVQCSDIFPLVIEDPVVYATSITLDQPTIEGEVGTTVTLTATVLPEDTTDKTVAWSSSDESIATVDQEGNVVILAIGTAIITAATTDGSNLKAECLVNGISSVGILGMEEGNVDVYTLQGVLLGKNVDSEYVSGLAKGTYIIRTPTKTFKIVK